MFSRKNPKPHKTISYELIRSDRRTISVEITKDLRVLVRAPRRASARIIEAFVQDHEEWIYAHLNSTARRVEQENERRAQLPLFTEAEIKRMTADARRLVTERIEYYAPLMGVSYNRICIKHQKTRWGSCSSKDNLNFNCLLAVVPPEILDYVVVHELCHLKEMNHSARFWREVGKVIPDYASRRSWLKTNGNSIIERLG